MDMSLSQALRVDDGRGGLACCSHSVAESDTTEPLNWTELKSLETQRLRVSVSESQAVRAQYGSGLLSLFNQVPLGSPGSFWPLTRQGYYSSECFSSWLFSSIFAWSSGTSIFSGKLLSLVVSFREGESLQVFAAWNFASLAPSWGNAQWGECLGPFQLLRVSSSSSAHLWPTSIAAHRLYHNLLTFV